MKDLPPLPAEGAHTLDEMWANISYFLKAVIPVAEKANVRLALHPNDPPVSLEPWFAADHGHGCRMEALDRDREQPLERDHFRLRRYPGDGRRSGGGLPLLRVRETASITSTSAIRM